MRTFILTSLSWLMVFCAVFAAHSFREKARWVDFQSDAVFSLSQFMEGVAKQDDPNKRLSMATEMGSATKEAHNLRELKLAIVKVSNKYHP